ncbi:MAG: phosphoribosylpyrophosphate synthetase [Myxococcota bacterium]|nr:hypothetical protein [Myxococcales bacterium]
METLRDALRRFERAGFRDAFRAEREGLRAIAAKRTYAPEELVIDEVARFEGDTDPQDEAVLFAVRADDGSVRGTLVATYGPQGDARLAELVHRLETAHRARTA